MSWVAQLPIAHRGLHGPGVPENSLPAFRAAVDAGYAIELDVRTTADGVPVVFHDDGLDRLTPERGPVASRRWAELATFGLAGTQVAIPSLEDALSLVAGQVPMLIELKNWGAPGALERAVAELLTGYDHPVAVQSFNPRSVGWFAQHAPSILRGQVAGSFDGIELEAWKRFLLRHLLMNWMSRPDFVAYEHASLPHAPVRMARQVGLPVVAWTVRSPASARAVQDHADNVIFENYEPELPS